MTEGVNNSWAFVSETIVIPKYALCCQMLSLEYFHTQSCSIAIQVPLRQSYWHNLPDQSSLHYEKPHDASTGSLKNLDKTTFDQEYIA